MSKLRTALAYELNNGLGDDHLKVDTHVLIGSKLSAFLRKNITICWGHVHELNTSLFTYVFLNKFNFYL